MKAIIIIIASMKTTAKTKTIIIIIFLIPEATQVSWGKNIYDLKNEHDVMQYNRIQCEAKTIQKTPYMPIQKRIYSKRWLFQ